MTGTNLLNALSGWGLKACSSCRAYAAKMDEWGPDGCEEHFDEVIEWLRSQAKRKRIPFFEVVAKRFLRSAIKKSRDDEQKEAA